MYSKCDFRKTHALCLAKQRQSAICMHSGYQEHNVLHARSTSAYANDDLKVFTNDIPRSQTDRKAAPAKALRADILSCTPAP